MMSANPFGFYECFMNTPRLAAAVDAQYPALVSQLVGSDPIRSGPIGENVASLQRDHDTGLKILVSAVQSLPCPPALRAGNSRNRELPALRVSACQASSDPLWAHR